MELVRQFNIGGALIKVIVKLHESSSPDKLLHLVTKGNETHMMAAMNWFRRRRLTSETFPGYFFNMIAYAIVKSIRANKRFITSPNMEVVVLVNAPKSMAETAAMDSPTDTLAQYSSVLSSLNYAFISFFPDPIFFSKYMQNESVLFTVVTHELQHHASESMDYGMIWEAIAQRCKNLRSQNRMGYHSWICILALNELLSEGLPKFSEYTAKGSYAVGFTILDRFVREFEIIPTVPRQILTINYYRPHLKTYAYEAGSAMFVTILAKRLILKRIFAYIKPISGGEFEPLRKLKFYYGMTDLYLVAPNAARVSPNDARTENHQLRMMNEAKALIAEMQDKSHLYFLSAYEESCRFLGVKPLISRELYVKVKLACHVNFLNLLASRGVPLDVAK